MVSKMFIDDIKTASPFRDLFPIQEELLERLVWDMRMHGYDQSKPIVVWGKPQPMVIDGHIRLRAARKAGLYQIPVVRKEFVDEAEALQYAIGCQRNRRNLRDAELFRCVEILYRKKPQGGWRGNKHTGGIPVTNHAILGSSSQETASLLGISPRKVERVRTILNRAPQKIVAAVRSGKMSINKANLRMMQPAISPPPDKVADVFTVVTSKLNKEEISELIARLQVYLTAP